MRYIKETGRLIWSASDLKAAAECEFAWLRAIDARLGRIDEVVEPEDATLERAGALGGVHEERVLGEYRARFGAKVVEIPQTRSSDVEGLAHAVNLTGDALRGDAEVIYQAAFSTEEFVGFADFLVRDEYRRWVVQDTKLARRARVTALMQLSAYVDQLDLLGVPRSERVELLLGDNSTSTHLVRDLLPVFGLRRARLRSLIVDRRLELGDQEAAIQWGDPRGELRVLACGRCATCDEEVVAARDLLMVAGMRPVQRERLRAAGITTLDELADTADAPGGVNKDTFALLSTQARLQRASDVATEGEQEPHTPPLYEVVAAEALGALPRPSRGDIFFDFEGDPLYTEGAGDWGIDYLFGWVDLGEQYTALWAHSLAEERVALETFIDLVKLRRAEHPDLHIFHYAPYEPTHLLFMAARHGTREAEVDQLLKDGVFVDLYPIVRRALRVGSRSYSIKKLEPLYMGDQVRTSDVQRGDDSIVRYVEACALQAEGAAGAAREIFDDLADYNRYDCVSTLRLRDWLVDRAREHKLLPALNEEPDDFRYEPSPQAVALTERAASHDPDSAEALALELASAALDYYPREAKSFWATHFLRLREPVSLWEHNRDVVIVDPERSRVRENWHVGEGRKRSERRILELRGDLAPGTRLKADGNPFALYRMPIPFPKDTSPRWIHADHGVRVLEVLDDGVLVEELAVDGETWSDLPIALTPQSPPGAYSQQDAINEWADSILDASPALPPGPATDILLRRAPRTLALEPAGEDIVSAIVAAVSGLDNSYLAVQGPPGTGKTYVGSHVIARLVRDKRWKIGVVAQSHAVVENMLDRIVAAGAPPELVAKSVKDAESEQSFTVVAKNEIASYLSDRSDTGFVVGGTAWDFSHPKRIPRQSLDLLVIDEAGQFSLAATIASSVASTRLLLLGDPQQLPQVSQGTHPAPVDTSALGWVMADSDVLPPEFGYFLAQTRRMHPDVAAPVSELSYRGALAAHSSTIARELEGHASGLTAWPVRHRGNATESAEEASKIVEIVQSVMGAPWHDVDMNTGERLAPRPLAQRDIIVVTPYNAQQVRVEEALSAAGFSEIPVGTVDRFQGQEAAVAILSLAASSAQDAPRGPEFLLLRNRLNVAISRAMYSAHLVYSPGLLDDLPRTPEAVARLSAFARLVDAVPQM